MSESGRKLLGVDTETSHWDKTSEFFAITQIGAYGKNDSFFGVMNPGESILEKMQPDVIGLTGLTAAKIRAADDEGLAFLSLIEFLSFNDVVIVAHNWQFDRTAIDLECKRREIPFDISKLDYIDSWRVVKELYEEGVWEPGGSKLPNMKLATCFYGIAQSKEPLLPGGYGPHNALYDAAMSYFVVETILEMGADVQTLIDISRETFVPRVCPIGREKGKAWADVDLGFLKWLADKQMWQGDEGLELAILEELNRRGAL